MLLAGGGRARGRGLTFWLEELVSARGSDWPGCEEVDATGGGSAGAFDLDLVFLLVLADEARWEISLST